MSAAIELVKNSDDVHSPEMEPGHRVTGSAILVGSDRVGSRVSVPDPVFDSVLSFNICVYRGVVSTQ